MAEEFIQLDYKELYKELTEFDKQMPNSAIKLMRAVNNEVRKQIRKTARSRGYKAHKQMQWGDAGYSSNIIVFANRDFTGKVMMSNNAFHYRFLEFGADVLPRHGKYLTFKIGDNWYKSEGFHLDARPLVYPVADSYWKTSKASQIMEQKFQEIMNKQFSK